MKKMWLFYTFTTILLISFLSFMTLTSHPIDFSQEKLAFSPLPAYFTLTANAQVTSLDVWSPNEKVQDDPTLATPDITGLSGVTYDVTTNHTLFEKNPQQKLPMASLTKIMTAIVALEHPNKTNKYIVTNDAIVGEDSMGLALGEILSMKDLLYGLFLHSGNDAAMTLAVNFPGGATKFTQAMNQKAQALGLINTHFTNPSGLEGDGDQHTTAYDLLVMTRYGLQHFPDFRETAATVEYIIPHTATHQEYDLENETNLLTTYPGVKGVKTGYTPEAGYCLVTYLEYADHSIIGVLLGSEDRRKDMKAMLDYSLEKLSITPPPHD